MDYEAKLESLAASLIELPYIAGWGNLAYKERIAAFIAILREAFPEPPPQDINTHIECNCGECVKGRKNHPVLNPELLVADIRAEGASGKGRWKMSRKAAGDAVIAFTKNWAANVLTAQRSEITGGMWDGNQGFIQPDSAKVEADELDKSLAVNIYNIATRGPWKTMPPDWPEVNERIQEIANKLSTRRPSAEPAKDAPRLPYKD